jgi:hypothetical protein
VRSIGGLVAALALSVAPSASAFENVTRGATATFEFGTYPVGDTLMGQIGGDWQGLRVSRDYHWVTQWEVFAALKGGYLGNQHPFLFLIGPHLFSWVEGGYRLSGQKGFSPYFGARIGGDVQLLGNPDVPQFDRINAVDGVGGVVAQGWARVGAGQSYVDDKRSVLIEVFAQELLQARQVNTPSHAFTGLGVSLRVDVPQSWTMTIEAAWGATALRRSAFFDVTDYTSRATIGGSLRKIFKNGMWIGGMLSYERDMDQVNYESAQTSYDTANAPMFTAQIFYGLPLWRSP